MIKMLKIDYNENKNILDKINNIDKKINDINKYIQYKKSLKDYENYYIDDPIEILLNIINDIKFDYENYYYNNNKLIFNIKNIEKKINELINNSLKTME